MMYIAYYKIHYIAIWYVYDMYITLNLSCDVPSAMSDFAIIS